MKFFNIFCLFSVGIRIPDLSGNCRFNCRPVVEWSGFKRHGKLFQKWDKNFASGTILVFQKMGIFLVFRFFAERGYNLLTEYYDSIKGRLSDSYSVTGQV